MSKNNEEMEMYLEFLEFKRMKQNQRNIRAGIEKTSSKESITKGNNFLAWLVICITIFIFILPVIAKHIGLVDKPSLAFTGYEPPEEKGDGPKKFYEDLEKFKK